VSFARSARPSHRDAAPAACRPLLLAALLHAGFSAAQPVVPPPQPAAPVAALPSPSATPYPGRITLEVDATDLDHRVLAVTETLPVAPGRLTLLYPRWLPGNHGPTGNPNPLAGLQVTAGDKPLAWQRDPVEVNAFHIEVPAGVSQLTLRFEHLSPLKSEQGRVSMSPALLGVQWNTVLLYPAGHATDGISVQPRLKLPTGWQAATALRAPDGQLAKADDQGWMAFGSVSATTLVDSPLFAGMHAKRIELDPPGTPQPVALNLFADEADQLDAKPEQIEAHRKLVQQTDKLYGARHWRHYDFLLSQSREFGGIGLEHHESSENGVRPGYFKDWEKAARGRDLLAHEFTHSWNGKFRRPDDLWTANFNQPMRGSLLWVYEGQTQFWGHVLATRSGLVTAAEFRDNLAHNAADLAARGGRGWRTLQDTTNEGAMEASRNKPWGDWQRGRDYYEEGRLIWLEADMLIREQSGDKRSLDDFARAFFGAPHATAPDGSILPRTYAFDDVVKALNGVQPYDWTRFLRERLDRTGADAAPLGGLARSGWRLVYEEKESEFAKADDGRGEPGGQDLSYSLGLRLDKDGNVGGVRWDGPAFQAGLAPGEQVLAVGMQSWKPERLAAAITANKTGQAPIELLVKVGERYKLVKIDYRGGLRYPKLERIAGTVDRLSAELAAR